MSEKKYNYSEFELQSWTKYMRQALVFMWNRAIQENFSVYFSAVFF